jgi:hypothetical protein
MVGGTTIALARPLTFHKQQYRLDFQEPSRKLER